MKKVIYGAFLVLAASCCVSLAAPEPAIVQAAGNWTVDVTFEHPQRISAKPAGRAKAKMFWYTILTLTNKTGRDVEFYPKCELMTDTFEIIPAGKGVSARLLKQIKRRHRRTYPFLESVNEAGNRILQGDDNAKDVVIIWPDFDRKANRIDLYIAGLSNETVVVEHPTEKDRSGKPAKVYLRKTLDVSYSLASDGVPRSTVRLNYEGKRWVMR